MKSLKQKHISALELRARAEKANKGTGTAPTRTISTKKVKHHRLRNTGYK